MPCFEAILSRAYRFGASPKASHRRSSSRRGRITASCPFVFCEKLLGLFSCLISPQVVLVALPRLAAKPIRVPLVTPRRLFNPPIRFVSPYPPKLFAETRGGNRLL